MLVNLDQMWNKKSEEKVNKKEGKGEKYLKKVEIECEEVNFKVTKAIHFLSSYTFYFVQLKNTRNLCKYMWQLKYQNNLW